MSAYDAAYPNSFASPDNNGFTSTQGLTKRELFAAMAMQGMLSGDPMWAGDPEYCAQIAQVQADNLIKRLERYP